MRFFTNIRRAKNTTKLLLFHNLYNFIFNTTPISLFLQNREIRKDIKLMELKSAHPNCHQIARCHESQRLDR